MSSRRTRIKPIFRWLHDHGGPAWPAELLGLCEGLHLPGAANGRANGRRAGRGRRAVPAFDPGAVLSVGLDGEYKVEASPERLAWMVRNAHRLVPRDPKKAGAYRKRVLDNPRRAEALALLDGGSRDGVPKKMLLEGAIRADCLVECDNVFVWVVGQRNGWLAPAARWDVARDALARQLEAVWNLAQEAGKEGCLILCHEHELKHHEEALIDGYRAGTWSAGWPHLKPVVRRHLGQRIGTVSWGRILAHWPELSEVPKLGDLAVTPG